MHRDATGLGRNLSHNLLASAFGLLVVVLVISGCGGSSATSGSSAAEVITSDLTKAQFTSKASQICTDGPASILPRLAKFERQHPASAPSAQKKMQAEALRAVVPPVMRVDIERIRALGAPSGREEQITALLEAMESDVERVENGPPTSLEELDSRFHHSGTLAIASGLKACSYG